MLIKAIRKSKSIQSCQQYVRKCSYKNFDESKFKIAIRNLKWLDIYLLNDVDEALKLFTYNLLEILNDMAPMRQFQIKKIKCLTVSCD